ncbi:MAG: hypothetical protein NZV14_03955 [Bryobacteraceae bacterium]|nr:hypothetical protein [Bryobacteraceae bacterium]MDW8377286.1 hypothetical protein [Bryobacterales bacterium]
MIEIVLVAAGMSTVLAVALGLGYWLAWMIRGNAIRKLQAIHEKLAQQGSEDLRNKQAQLQALERKLIAQGSALKAREEEIIRLRKRLATVEKQLLDQVTEFEVVSLQMEAREKKLESVTADLTRAQNCLATLQSEFFQAQTSWSEQEKTLREQLSAVTNQIDNLTQERNQLIERESRLSAELQSRSDSLMQLEKKYAELQQLHKEETSRLRQSLDQAQQAAGQAALEIAGLEQRLRSLESERPQARVQANRATAQSVAEVHELQERLQVTQKEAEGLRQQLRAMESAMRTQPEARAGSPQFPVEERIGQPQSLLSPPLQTRCETQVEALSRRVSSLESDRGEVIGLLHSMPERAVAASAGGRVVTLPLPELRHSPAPHSSPPPFWQQELDQARAEIAVLRRRLHACETEFEEIRTASQTLHTDLLAENERLRRINSSQMAPREPALAPLLAQVERLENHVRILEADKQELLGELRRVRKSRCAVGMF